jgi:manganese/zinc/iron transport system substrate-binding protein
MRLRIHPTAPHPSDAPKRPRFPRPLRDSATLLVAGLALLSGCGGGGAPEAREAGAPLRVVATIGMIGDLAERIGAERVAVQTLMGPGIDPHLYRAAAGDLQTLASADLILYNGLHLEAALGEVLEEMNRRTRTVAVAEVVPPEQLLAPPEFEGAFDPHLWSDVGLWRQVAQAIRDALAEADPEGTEAYRAGHAALDAELAELDAWVRDQVARLPVERRILVTAHDAFNYFGRAYDFEVRGLQGLSTVTEAGAADVQALAAFLLEREVPALFVESSIAPRTVEAVRRAVLARGGSIEIGGTLFSDAMGSAGTPEGSYVGMIRHNVSTVVDALSGAMGDAGSMDP